MKKSLRSIFLFLFLAGISPFLLAQNPFTKRQVYDFNPGDILQVTRSFNATPGPPVYETFEYLSKSQSSAGDTLYYQVAHVYYRPASCLTCDPTETKDTFTQKITDLDSIIDHENKTTELMILDSFYLKFCNKNVWEKYPASPGDSIFFEPIKHRTYFVEGLGGPYYHLEMPQGGPTILDFELTYYSKNQVSCGTYFSGINSIQKNMFNVLIVPNPMDGNAVIKFPKKLDAADLRIYSLDGLLIKEYNHIDGNEFQITELKTGIYQIVVTSNGDTAFEKLLVR